MQFDPTARDRQIKAGRVFRRRSFVAEQERAVEFLDIDAAVLHRLEGVRAPSGGARPSRDRCKGVQPMSSAIGVNEPHSLPDFHQREMLEGYETFKSDWHDFRDLLHH